MNDDRMWMTRDELISLVDKIRSGTGSEADEDRWITDLRAAVSDPRVIDYIFWDRSEPPLTSEQIIDKALAYRVSEL